MAAVWQALAFSNSRGFSAPGGVADLLLMETCNDTLGRGAADGLAGPRHEMRIKIAELRVARLAERAYTIAELAVSTLLVATLFLSLYGGMSSGFSYTQGLRENLRATQVMLERTEGIRLYNWDQLNSNGFIPSTFTAYYQPAVGGTGVNAGVVYTGSLAVSSVSFDPPASYSTNMRMITVRIGWLSTFGRSNTIVRQRAMRTYVGRNGMQNYIYNN